MYIYIYTKHVKCNVTCGSHVKCNVYIYWSHVTCSVTCGPHAEGADLGGGSAVDRSAKLCRIHSLLPRVQGHDLYVYARISIYIYMSHICVCKICVYTCVPCHQSLVALIIICIDTYMYRVHSRHMCMYVCVFTSIP